MKKGIFAVFKKFLYSNANVYFMNRVIPAILEQSVGDIQEKLDRIAGLADCIHLDIGDGVFIPDEIMNDPGVLDLITTEAKIDLHLMIELPEIIIDRWLAPIVARVTLHIEATQDMETCIAKVRDAGKQVFLALNPETPLTMIDAYREKVDGCLIMGVHPGYGGQEFLEQTYDRIRMARARYATITIAVDGGVKYENAQQIIESGADQLVMGSGLFDHDTIEEIIQKINAM
ncbi:MAG TPA: hypothetical protein DCY49_00420 [Candidatus Jacksonbacteria bacterium]|nr:hypothetical protein [Candidatus Jacksonbacteria bacterium]